MDLPCQYTLSGAKKVSFVRTISRKKKENQGNEKDMLKL